MSEKINQIVEELKTLTLLEASELVTQIEETFGVDASSAAGGTMVMANWILLFLMSVVSLNSTRQQKS